tara:strand:+ start:300 stop:473 length:174 start_codon:yes stop_codon:yes gene_type:complete
MAFTMTEEEYEKVKKGIYGPPKPPAPKPPKPKSPKPKAAGQKPRKSRTSSLRQQTAY